MPVSVTRRSTLPCSSARDPYRRGQSLCSGPPAPTTGSDAGKSSPAILSDHLGGGRLAADVEILSGRVGANHQEIRAGLDPAMAGPGGQQRHVASLDIDFPPLGSAQHQPRGPCREAENFVRGGVIVMIAVNAVAPLRRPAMTSKQPLEASGHRLRVALGQHAPVQQHGQAGIVRNPAVALEKQGLRLHDAVTAPAFSWSADPARRRNIWRAPRRTPAERRESMRTTSCRNGTSDRPGSRRCRRSRGLPLY